MARKAGKYERAALTREAAAAARSEPFGFQLLAAPVSVRRTGALTAGQLRQRRCVVFFVEDIWARWTQAVNIGIDSRK